MIPQAFFHWCDVDDRETWGAETQPSTAESGVIDERGVVECLTRAVGTTAVEPHRSTCPRFNPRRRDWCGSWCDCGEQGKCDR